MNLSITYFSERTLFFCAAILPHHPSITYRHIGVSLSLRHADSVSSELNIPQKIFNIRSMVMPFESL